MEALSFLEKAAKAKRLPVFVLFGDEDFLKRRCREAITHLVLGDEANELAITVFNGETLEMSAVRDELDTLPFVGPARVVVVENADPFITEHREALERYVASPSKLGVLILDAKTFPETTKLAKALPDAAKLQCKSPPPVRLPDWCVGWAKSQFQKQLQADAAHMLVDLIGPSIGLLAQEIDKLSTAIGPKPAIGCPDVEAYVPRTRAANVFHILDAVSENNPARAMGLLTELLDEGEEPLAILGALTHQLRKLAAVGREIAAGHSLGVAMDTAGIPKWPQARQSCERQVRHLGRQRLGQLTDWLIELNLGLKGGNALPYRLQLERLLVRLARPWQAMPDRA
jgi:DNA polymerase-3 subunit delta